jgi:hypothetical protein
LDPAHQQALLKEKRQAFHSSPRAVTAFNKSTFHRPKHSVLNNCA